MRSLLRAVAIVVAATVALSSSSVHADSSDRLCSVPPNTYTRAKQTNPELAFAIAELEKQGIATWYTDRSTYQATANQLVAQCPPSSRLSIVVYGLPNKDCVAGESRGGSNKNSADYQNFVSYLQQTVGNRKALYVLEPDAVALLAEGGCAQQLGYGENLAIAIRTLSTNPNADIYVDVGHWMLSNDKQLGAVTGVVKQLMAAGPIKGITINTSNYRSNQELSGLCGKFRAAMGRSDLHCIIDTSRNYNGPSGKNEWCNYKGAAIGKLPTGATGDPNVDYYIWIKPPGDSDGRCVSNVTPDALPGPEAGLFHVDYFKQLWNEGVPVKELNMPKIDGTIRAVMTDAPTAAPTTPAPTTVAPNTTAPRESRDADELIAEMLKNGTTSSGVGMTEEGAGVVVPPQDEPVFENTPAPVAPTVVDGPAQEANTQSQATEAMSSGIVVLLSDSTDATAVHLLPEHILRRIRGNASASYDQVFGGSRIHLNRGHEPRLNYALIPGVGLNLYLMYILGVDPTQTPEDRVAVRVQLARQEFERLAPNGTEPDIVVVHNDHWSLSAYSKESPEAFAPPANTLTQAYIASYLRNMSDFVHLARQAFPSSLMVTHTSVMVRHNANSGREEGHVGWKGRGWVNRMFVTQLNQATRYLARQLNLPLVDWDLITLGLTPSQTLRDDIHPKDWLMHEFYNIMLNLHEAYALGTKTMMKRHST